MRAAAARSAAPPRTPARELGDRFRTAPRSAATEIRADHRCARGYTADTARRSRVSTPAPIPARRRGRHAPSPSCGCRPADTGRSERRRPRRWDGPSRRSHPVPTTNPFRACPRRPWRRERMPHRPAASLAASRVRTGVVTRDLLTGDDGHGPVDAPQRLRDAMRITRLRGGLPRRLDTAVDGQGRLLNILGQQQHCRTTAAGCRNRLGQRRKDILGLHHAPAVHRHRREQRLRVRCAVSATGVLEGAPAVERASAPARSAPAPEPGSRRLLPAPARCSAHRRPRSPPPRPARRRCGCTRRPSSQRRTRVWPAPR